MTNSLKPRWLGAVQPRRWSISFRLSAVYGAAMLVLLLVFAGTTYTYLHKSKHQDFDQHLNHEHRVLLPQVTFDDAGRPVFEHLEQLRTVAYQTDGIYGTYVRLIDREGTVLYQSPNFEDHVDFPLHLPEQPVAAQLSQEWEDQPVRTHYLPLTHNGQMAGWLEVSGYEWSVHQDLVRLRQTYAIAALLTLLLAMAGGYLLARRALAPVARITSAANDIEPSDLSARVPTDSLVQDELSSLAQAFNRLLDRLEASFRRERRFSSYAAHELVTPLAVLRGELELALQSPDTSEAGITAALAEVDRMNGIVRSLRELSTAEGLRSMPRTRLDLGRLCRDHMERFRDRAEVHSVNLHMTAERDIAFQGDAAAFGKVVDNLIDNALKYTPAGGDVRIRVYGSKKHALLEVRDQGCGFAAEEADRLFDRFFRSNNSAVQNQPGSGLGLSIVRASVEALGGTVHASSEGVGMGSVFEVRLPRA